MKKAESILREALAETGAVVPLQSTGRGGQIDFLCKQIPGHESRWLYMVESLLRWAEQSGLYSNFLIARRYLLKDDRMVFGWFLSLDLSSAVKLQEACETLAKCLASSTKGAEGILVDAPKAAPRQAVPAPQVEKTETPRIRIVKQWIDDNGKQWEESVMPLPHAHKDLNVPSKPRWSEEHGRFIGGQRGAKKTV